MIPYSFRVIAILLGMASTVSVAQGPERPDAARKEGSYLLRVSGDRAALAAASVSGFSRSPLFARPAVETRARESADWFILVPEGKNAAPATWDGAHELAVRIAAATRNSSIYVEPNQIHTPIREASLGEGPDPRWPSLPDPAWHLGRDHSQLMLARKHAGSNGCTPRLIILDTGIYRKHVTVPRGTNVGLEKNFVEPGKSADDPGTAGPMKSPGHGTATAAVLAGGRVKLGAFDDDLGGAPDAEIVPVRIADSVVHFWSDEMARGIDYAYELAVRRKENHCEVVSISMGGVASRSWADAVNRAYDEGVTIVAAAGNNFNDLPTRYTVYPSRFSRVITATGATAKHTPFRHQDPKVMQGNYGPPSVMNKAIAAYTPNIARARWGTPDTIDLNGSGTSYATPQVAAAAALWLQANASLFSADWKRVEAVRLALFETAEKTLPDAPTSREYFGWGLLRADGALGHRPSALKLEERPRDDVSFPLFRILLGLDERNGKDKMYEVEATNIALLTSGLARYIDDRPIDAMGPDEFRRAASGIANDPRASQSLKTLIRTRLRDRGRR